MSDSKKKRMSMLDNLAGAKAPAPPTTMMSTNRALRSARDAVDSHTVWELDPAAVIDDRPEDRLDREDVQDLVDAIEANGQIVPILVRRHPAEDDKYLLVYGRRRLEAIRQSAKVTKVRALVANLNDDTAVRAQISENMARRDLSFIEKALFAARLIDTGFGNQSDVAEVLTVSKSSVSMALSVVDMVGRDLIEVIGPAHGVGRPRWEALGRAIVDTGVPPEAVLEAADDARTNIAMSVIEADDDGDRPDPSVEVFEAVFRFVMARGAPAKSRVAAKVAAERKRPLKAGGRTTGSIRRTGQGLTIEITDKGFADWLDSQLDALVTDLHAQWKSSAGDQSS